MSSVDRLCHIHGMPDCSPLLNGCSELTKPARDAELADVRFRVYGTPKPQGSKRHVGKGVMVESGGAALRTWREDVKHAALSARELLGEQLDGPIAVTITFYLRRPASHFRTGKNAHLLRDAAPWWPHRKPDIDKLLRSTLDAITSAGLWNDDAQAVRVHMSKEFCATNDVEGAAIRLEQMEQS